MSRPRPVSVSFEFFPPGDEAMEKTLWSSIRYLEPLNPSFVSVTYGADGSTRERTHNVVSRLQAEHSLNCVPHLTCIGASRGEVLDIARRYWDQGIRHIVALRGDPPAGTIEVRTACRWLRLRGGPGGRPQDRGGFRDLGGRVSGKTSGGARASSSISATSSARSTPARSRAITQFFYDTDMFLRFRDRCAARGIDAPIVPGILPITRFPQITRFAARCGATHSGLAGASLRRARGQSRDAQADLRRRRHRAGAHAAAARRRAVSFLHAEPLGADLRDLPCARRAAARGAQGGQCLKPWR